MKAVFAWLLLPSLLSFAVILDAKELPIGQHVTDFALQDFRGKQHRLSEYSSSELVVLVFTGTECPLAKLYAPRLDAMSREFTPRGVQILGIFPNRHDSMTEIAASARRHGLTFPLLRDTGNHVADELSVERTPEAIVLDRERHVRYRGRIDDQYGVGYAKEKANRPHLRIAIEELLADKPVSEPRTEAVGCIIGRVMRPDQESSVTYANQISRILQKHCVECHRQGDIAPFALTDYEEVSGWAEMIAEVVEDQRMPPWHASSEHGQFANARVMSNAEKQLVYDWAAAGAPQGDPRQLPEPIQYTSGWRLPREPDQVIPMRTRPYQVAAEGIIEYQYFIADPGFTEDKWIKAAEVIPGNRAVVHHAIAFVRKPGKLKGRDGIGWLAAYVPGQTPMVLPDGAARFIPAGSKLVFQMHYTPTGSPQVDTTKVGLIFADPEEVQEEVVTLPGINREFQLQANQAHQEVRLRVPVWPEEGRLLAFGPHMHLRGQSFRMSIQQGNDSRQLLDVPRYDFNWQHIYELQHPIEIEPGQRVEAVCSFDNSAANLANPDPSQTVRWGDQTHEEMALVFLDVALPRNWRSRLTDDRQHRRRAELQVTRERARALLQRFDQNHDGKLTRDELPPSFAIFGFRRLDANDDGAITLDEASVWAQSN